MHTAAELRPLLRVGMDARSRELGLLSAEILEGLEVGLQPSDGGLQGALRTISMCPY